jgi:sugar phosphate isomerase/epimerase
MTQPIDAVGFNAAAPNGDIAALGRVLDRQVELGCEACELTAATLDAVADCRLVPARVDAVRRTLAPYRLRWTLHAPIPINLMDEDHRDWQLRAAKAALELGDALDARTVVLHPGRVHPGRWAEAGDDLLARERETLFALGERARALGVVVAYENLSPNPKVVAGAETSYALDPAALAAQLGALDHPHVRACLDVSHAQQGAGLLGFELHAALARLGPWIAHLHFSDSTGVPLTLANDGRPETMHWFGAGDMHAPPGWGRIDFAGMARATRARPGSTMIIELRPNVRTHAEAATLAAARTFAAAVTPA